MEVRRATLADADAVAALLTELGYPVAGEAMCQRLECLLARPDHAAFVASCDGHVVGMVGAFANRRYESDAPYGQLLALIVSEAYRRRGAGTALVVAAERWLHEQHVDCVVVHAGGHRKGSHEFYARLGYSATGLRFVKTVGSAPN